MRRGEAERWVDSLLVSPPTGPAELEWRLRTVEPRAVRRALVDRLAAGRVQRRLLGLVEAALTLLGAGPEIDRLRAIALDARRSIPLRAAALRACGPDARVFGEVLERVGPATALELVGDTVREGLLSSDPGGVAGLVATFLHGGAAGDPEAGLAALAIVEEHRRSAGLSPSVYGEALEADLPEPVVEALLEILVDEPDEPGAALLERLRDAAADPGRRRMFQKALLRARSADIEPAAGAPPVPGYALVSHCDGQGAFVLVGLFENADGTHTAADLCIRAAGDVRDGFVAPRLDARDQAELARQLEEGAGLRLVRVSLPEAAALVDEAVDRTRRAGRPLPRDARDSVRFFERVRPEGRRCPAVAPAPRVLTRRVRALLDRPEYESWFFDHGDLEGAGVPPAPGPEPSDAWVSAAARALDTPAMRARIAGMTAHMARWHHWNGEPDEAALCAALAARCRRGLARHPLVRLMLADSPVDGPAPRASVALGDPNLRRQLKAEHFAEVRSPRGRDQARLDFTEAAWVLLDSLFAVLPGEHRPRDEDLGGLAYEIGAAAADAIRGRRGGSLATVRRRSVARLEAAAGLPPGQAEIIIEDVLRGLATFANEVCADCPTHCLDRPAADFRDVFFRDAHPALDRGRRR